MPTNINDKLISWASEIDELTVIQAQKTARLPIIEGHVALMPDAHVGKGATIGSVIPTTSAVIPSAVGVDIGCGMIAAELDVTEDQLPDTLEPLLGRIERAIPAGVGRGHDEAADQRRPLARSASTGDRAVGRPVGSARAKQFGTLGSGNHFFELCVDERGRLWVVLHSGSRGIGNKLATMHITKARNLAKALELRLEDLDLAYFTEGTPEFEAYIADMLWAQEYARANRDQMMDKCDEGFAFLGFGRETQRINCHHNFTEREVHDGRELWVTRKGAIRADTGDLGVIPGSMGTRSYIVAGKGNAASWRSCSHGAGRRHSRTKAKKLFTADDLAEQMAGKVWQSSRADSAAGRDPGGVQGHRQGHGRPDRPGRGPAHAAAGPELQGHLTPPVNGEPPPGTGRAGGRYHHHPCRRGPEGRTLGPYPRSSGFDPRRRPCAARCEGRGLLLQAPLPARAHLRSTWFPGGRTDENHGLEALMVERPVETRQGEVRALPRPLVGSTSTKGVSQQGKAPRRYRGTTWFDSTTPYATHCTRRVGQR